MQTIHLITLLLTSATLATSYIVPTKRSSKTCGTCNPLSGENNCDPSTSCINTGKRFHCACRAGYKASPDNNDITKHFRLDIPNFNFLVFTPESTVCNTLCENPYGAGPDLCSEVPVRKQCAV